MRLRCHVHRGFTLVELAIVVLILGIAMTIVAVNVSVLIPHERLRGAANNIGNLLQYARSEAAATGVNFAVVYDLDENAYWLLVPRTVDERYEQTRTRDEDTRIVYLPNELPDGVEFEDIQFGEGAKRTRGEIHIEITPMGTASGHIVHLINRHNDDEQFSVELNALTGRVTYHEGYVEFEEVIDYD